MKRQVFGMVDGSQIGKRDKGVIKREGAYVRGEVHASDGRRCHPSVRGDISIILNTPISMCVPCVALWQCHHTTPSHVRTPTNHNHHHNIHITSHHTITIS